ncbi:MAG: hypothetical protein HUU38_19220 [Anaerolineales bacterium]|nr:hypothetical protein [Anaerolineales bacterium]
MDNETGWLAAEDQGVGEWVELSWPTEMLVSSIRLVGPPPNGGDWGGFGSPEEQGDYYVEAGTLKLYRQGVEVESFSINRIEPLENGGTLLVLDTPLVIDQLRFTVEAISGRWHWQEVAALNEIEVIGMASEPWPLLEIMTLFLPLVGR